MTANELAITNVKVAENYICTGKLQCTFRRQNQKILRLFVDKM
jgi:hypothetical protein